MGKFAHHERLTIFFFFFFFLGVGFIVREGCALCWTYTNVVLRNSGPIAETRPSPGFLRSDTQFVKFGGEVRIGNMCPFCLVQVLMRFVPNARVRARSAVWVASIGGWSSVRGEGGGCSRLLLGVRGHASLSNRPVLLMYLASSFIYLVSIMMFLSERLADPMAQMRELLCVVYALQSLMKWATISGGVSSSSGETLQDWHLFVSAFLILWR